MSNIDSSNAIDGLGRVLLVDDEDKFRLAMKRQLEVRDYRVWDVNNGEDAIKIVRHKNPEVIILDQKMPKMDGIETLKEIKKIRPEVQVIMLTGYGSTESARITGKYDVFNYMQKPCVLEDLIGVIEEARRERVYAMARHEIPHVKRASLMHWLAGAHHARPGVTILGLILFLAVVLMPAPEGLRSILGAQKTGTLGEKNRWILRLRQNEARPDNRRALQLEGGAVSKDETARRLRRKSLAEP